MRLARGAHGLELRLLLAAGTVCCALCIPAGEALAQQRRPGDTISQPVVQGLPNTEELRLNGALSRLGRNPRDLQALIDAGEAALALGDVDAASGFFKRADQVSSKDPRVKAGQGRALVRSGNPLEAIPLFDAAERAGADLNAIAADRGLAYDLIGDGATAQRLYRLALSRGAHDEATRRLALSLAIAGDRRGAEATLLPLLRQQDKAAWRARTFALAILGEAEESVRTARTILPEQLADSMAPYLRYMPQLTKAQQAAAANLGNFPRASEIGRDDPRFAQFIARAPLAPSLASADTGLMPRGEPLGRTSRSRGDREAAQPARPARLAIFSSPEPSSRPTTRIAPPEPQPTRELAPNMGAPVVGSGQSAVPQLAAIASGPAPAASAVAQPVQPSSGPVSPALAPAATPAAESAPRPGFDLAQPPQSQPAALAAVPPSPPASVPAAPVAQPPPRVSLAEVFRDLGAPTTGAAPAAGAVDIRRIAPARTKAPEKAAPAKPPPPSHPSRIWVQLGVGRDKGALATDWKKYLRQAAAPLKGRKPYVSDMGQTNRMLVGPFDSSAQANKFMSDLRGAGLNGSYVWTSPAGQVVDALPIR